MYQRAITIEQWADIFETMIVVGQIDGGAHLTTVGKHPDLGTLTAIQDASNGIIILSELPASLALIEH